MARLLAKRQQLELSPLATERITRVVRSMAEDQVERGVELGHPMHCDSCDLDKAPGGAALYGAYKFCNDCLLDFTLAIASGAVGNAAEYMTRQSDDEHLTPPSDLETHRERHVVSLNPLQGRDKLMPRNEPC